MGPGSILIRWRGALEAGMGWDGMGREMKMGRYGGLGDKRKVRGTRER